MATPRKKKTPISDEPVFKEALASIKALRAKVRKQSDQVDNLIKSKLRLTDRNAHLEREVSDLHVVIERQSNDLGGCKTDIKLAGFTTARLNNRIAGLEDDFKILGTALGVSGERKDEIGIRVAGLIDDLKNARRAVVVERDKGFVTESEFRLLVTERDDLLKKVESCRIVYLRRGANNMGAELERFIDGHIMGYQNMGADEKFDGRRDAQMMELAARRILDHVKDEYEEEGDF